MMPICVSSNVKTDSTHSTQIVTASSLSGFFMAMLNESDIELVGEQPVSNCTN